MTKLKFWNLRSDVIYMCFLKYLKNVHVCHKIFSYFLYSDLIKTNKEIFYDTHVNLKLETFQSNMYNPKVKLDKNLKAGIWLVQQLEYSWNWYL